MGTFSLPPPVNYVALAHVYAISSIADKRAVPFQTSYHMENFSQPRSVPIKLYYFGEVQAFPFESSTPESEVEYIGSVLPSMDPNLMLCAPM